MRHSFGSYLRTLGIVCASGTRLTAHLSSSSSSFPPSSCMYFFPCLRVPRASPHTTVGPSRTRQLFRASVAILFPQSLNVRRVPSDSIRFDSSLARPSNLPRGRWPSSESFLFFSVFFSFFLRCSRVCTTTTLCSCSYAPSVRAGVRVFISCHLPGELS